jgi:hypothetical protein
MIDAMVRRLVLVACRMAVACAVCAVVPSPLCAAQIDVETIAIVGQDSTRDVGRHEALSRRDTIDFTSPAAGARASVATPAYSGRRLSATLLAPLRC